MKKTRSTLTIILAILFLLSAGSTIYLYKQLMVLKQNPQAAAQQEAQELIAKVGQLIVLPQGEEPTVVTVVDPEKLKDQAFFASAQKGDKALIYTNAKKAILYSSSTNKILEVAPINFGDKAAAE